MSELRTRVGPVQPLTPGATSPCRGRRPADLPWGMPAHADQPTDLLPDLDLAALRHTVSSGTTLDLA